MQEQDLTADQGGHRGQREEREGRHFTARLHVARSERRRRASSSAENSFVHRLTRRRTWAAESSARTIVVVTASIGIRGQGNSLKRGFAQLKNVEIKTLCDIDANLAAEARQRLAAEGRRDLQARLRPGPASRDGRQGHRRRRHRDAEPLARARDHLGVSRPASTSTSRSRPRTPCGKAARWSRRRRATTRSCRSAR